MYIYLCLNKVEKFYDLMVKKGMSDLDHSALYLLLKRLEKLIWLKETQA